MDKRIEEVVNEQLNNEIWSFGVYMAFQLYFSEQNMPMLSSWLGMQVQKKAARIGKITAYLLAGGLEVSVKGQVFTPQDKQEPMAALEAFFSHEQYFHRQVDDFLSWTREVDDSSLRCLAFDLYADEVNVSDFFFELLRILAKEWRRMLPLE